MVEPLGVGCGVIGDVYGRESACLGHPCYVGDGFGGYELIDCLDTLRGQFKGEGDGHKGPFGPETSAAKRWAW
nr:hypothetical protein [Mycobacterium colombiense]